MSEELEKKPKAVVHKKVVDSQNQQESQGAASQPKKKIVIVKKKNPQVPQNSRPNSNVRVVAKKNDETESEKKLEDFWLDIYSTDRYRSEMLNFVGQKPEALIERILSIGTSESDIVLDYHLGSGTTAAVAHKMNRQ